MTSSRGCIGLVINKREAEQLARSETTRLRLPDHPTGEVRLGKASDDHEAGRAMTRTPFFGRRVTVGSGTTLWPATSSKRTRW